MSKKSGAGKGLGKGLGAIFIENESPIEELGMTSEEAKNAEELDIKKISANPFQPRRHFDEEKLGELAASIKEFGVVQPLIVRRKGRGYELVAGERRLRAAKLAGLEAVPAIVRDYDDAKLMEIALVENIQRHDLNAIEEAQGLRRLMQEFGLTQEQAAAKVGRSRVAVTNILRLLNLSKGVQEYIAAGAMSMGQAKQLIGLSEKDQLDIAGKIIANGWSARMTEEVVRRLKEGKKVRVSREIVEEEEGGEEKRPAAPKGKRKVEKDVFTSDFESQLIELLGTKVSVVPKPSKEGSVGGTIQIEYYSHEDLKRIYEILQQKEPEAAPRRSYGRLNV